MTTTTKTTIRDFILATYKDNNKRIHSKKVLDNFVDNILPKEINKIIDDKLFDKRYTISKNISVIVYSDLTIEIYFISKNDNIDETLTIKGDNMKIETELKTLQKELDNKETKLIKDIKETKELLDNKKIINDKLDKLTIETYENSIILLNNKIRHIVLDETLDTNKNKKVKNTIKEYKDELINKANIEKDNKVFKGLNIAIKVLNNSNNVSFAKLKYLSFEIATKYSKLSNSNKNKINFKNNVVEISEAIMDLYSEQLKQQQKENKMKIYNEIKKELNK